MAVAVGALQMIISPICCGCVHHAANLGLRPLAEPIPIPGLATCLPHKGGGVRLSALLNKSVEDRIVFMRQNCVCDNCANMVTFLNFVSHFQHARLLIVLTNIIIYFTEKSKLTGL